MWKFIQDQLLKFMFFFHYVSFQVGMMQDTFVRMEGGVGTLEVHTNASAQSDTMAVTARRQSTNVHQCRVSMVLRVSMALASTVASVTSASRALDAS